MDPLLRDLSNMGGMGLLAAVLFWLLYRLTQTFDRTMERALGTFREEMAAEREQCKEDHARQQEALEALTETVRQVKDELVIIKDRQGRL